MSREEKQMNKEQGDKVVEESSSAVVQMAEKIMEMVKERLGTSFVELESIDGFKGNFAYGNEKKNAWFWFHVSETAAEALNSLLKEERIEIKPTQSLVYFVDGVVPNFPLVKQNRAYKTEHWLPVCLYVKKSA